MKKTVRIDVTREDIDKAWCKRGDPEKWPIAVAVRRMVNGVSIYAGFQYLYLNGQIAYGSTNYMRWQDILLVSISADQVKPFSFKFKI